MIDAAIPAAPTTLVSDASLKAALGFGYLKVGRANDAGTTCTDAMELGLGDVATLFAFGRLFEPSSASTTR